MLIQNRQEVMRCAMTTSRRCERLLNLFFAYERPEIAEFRKAVEQFKTDLPAVLDALREHDRRGLRGQRRIPRRGREIPRSTRRRRSTRRSARPTCARC